MLNHLLTLNKTVWLTLASWAILITPALAQDEAAPAGEGGKSYALAWLVVVLAVALGVFVTLRPAHREAQVKQQQPD